MNFLVKWWAVDVNYDGKRDWKDSLLWFMFVFGLLLEGWHVAGWVVACVRLLGVGG